MSRNYLSLLLVLLVGCSSTLTSRTALVDRKDQKLSIYASGVNGPTRCDITIYVNGQAVAKGATTTIQPTTNFSGDYQGMKVDAECVAVATGGLQMSHRCTIYTAGEKAAELQF